MIEPFPESIESVDHLIQDLGDGVITPEDHQRLMEIMRTNAGVRQRYRRHMVMASMLHELAESRAEMGTLPVSQEMITRATRRTAVASTIYGMAAMLILGLGFWIYRFKLSPPPVRQWIVMEDSDNARFSVSYVGKATRDPHTLQAGDKIILDHGLVRFTFPSGVESIIEGPSILELISEDSVRMDGGLAWFQVPPAGHGFTVETEGMRVIDLGTEFGLWFDGEGTQQVHVAKGRVRVEPVLKIFDPIELEAGEAMVFDAFGRGKSVESKPSLFRQEFERRMPYLHWSFDQLVDGGFEATGTIPGMQKCRATVRPGRGDQEEEPGASQTAGRFGAAFSMDGKGRFAETEYAGIGGNAPRTFAAWVRHRKDRSSGGAITPYCAWGSREFGRLWKVYLWEKGGQTSLNTSIMSCDREVDIPADTLHDWMHIASVYTGRRLDDGYPEILLYLNGILQESSPRHSVRAVDTDVSSISAAPVRFGASLNHHSKELSVDGDLDEAYLFRGVLNASQIKQLMETNHLDFFTE